MRYVIEYLVVFLVIFILNYIFFIRKNKKYDKNNVPIELMYIVKRYGVKVKKIDYRRFVWIYSVINTFIVTTTYIVVLYLVKGIFFQIIIGVVLIVLLIIICYGILASFYLKKEGK